MAARFGVVLDDWQRLVLDTALEVDERGLPAYRDVCTTLPRQSGKTVMTFAVVMHRLMHFDNALVLYGAQRRQDARTRLVDEWAATISRSELADDFRLSRGAGFECLEFLPTGSRLRLLSTTDAASGHGWSPCLVALDEVWAMKEHVSESVRPSTIAVPGSQIVAISTAGDSSSTWWKSQVDAGRQAVMSGDQSVCFHEWSAPMDADIADPAVWRACMPALGSRIDERVVKGEFDRLPEHEWRRGFLNQWVTDSGDSWQWLSEDVWMAGEYHEPEDDDDAVA